MRTNYQEKLGFWESIIGLMVGLAVIAALAKGYGPAIGLGALTVLVVLAVARMAILIFRILLP